MEGREGGREKKVSQPCMLWTKEQKCLFSLCTKKKRGKNIPTIPPSLGHRGAKRGNYRIRQCPPIWHLIINKPHFSFPHLGKRGSVRKKKKLDGTFRLRDEILNAREFKEATKEAGCMLTVAFSCSSVRCCYFFIRVHPSPFP